MSTRALYTFKDQSGEYHVYKHHDGYPSGAVDFIAAAQKLAWVLPRFEADEFAASFVAANKTGDGGVRLTSGATWTDAASSDIEYRYTISAKNGELFVECDSVDCNYETSEWTVKSIKRGNLWAVTTWAKTVAA